MGEKFEQYCEQATQTLFTHSGEPFVFIQDEKVISGCVTELSAADMIIDELSPEQKLELIDELIGEATEYRFTIEMDESTAFSKMIDELLKKAIADVIGKNPRVKEQVDRNLDAHDRFRYGSEDNDIDL